MDRSNFYSLLKSLPKAELHLHEEAVLGSRTIKELYKKSHNEDMTDEQYAALFSYEDLEGFLESFMAIQRYFTQVSDLAYIVDDVKDYIKENNIIHLETFFSPTSLLKKGFDFSESIKIITEGFKKIEDELGCTIRVIVDVSRSFGLENAQHNLDLVLKENNPMVIGIGLGGSETFGPARDFATVFQKAKEAGLHRVVHAGETELSWSMKDSINLLSAERIGHGISAVYDNDFVKELAQSHFPLEVCPTSNVFTKKYVKSFADHPVKKLYDAGVFVTINTDDPVFFKVSLIDEYWNIYSSLGFTLEDIKILVKNAFKAAFISEEMKDNYCKKVDLAWDAWFESHPDVKKE